MLYWTKYKIIDRFDDDLLIWNTRTSSGMTIHGDIETVIESVKDGVWNESCSEYLKRILIESETLISKEQYGKEELLVKNYRDSIVFDDSFMSLTLIPTDRCNFNCLYCYQSDTVHNMTTDTADSIIKMIERNKSLKKLHISWFGGEPLCNKRIVFYLMERINEVCKRRGIVLIGDMTTNASLLDLETFSKLYSLKVLNYQITIDGCKETHNIQRPMKNGQDSYQLIMENLLAIRDHIPGKFFKIGIRTNFTDFVDDKFKSLKSDLISNFSSDQRFYFFFQWVKNWGGNRVSAISNVLLNDDDAINKYGRWMDEMSLTPVRTGDVSMIRAGSGLCIGCRKNSYLIDTDGSLCKCTTAIYDNDFRDRAIIGKINDNGIISINKWNEAAWISADASFEECRKCSQYPICLGMPCPYYKQKHKKVICNKDDTYIRYMLRALSRQKKIANIKI